MQVYRPYPGVALVVCPTGSVLVGAPTDAFKATKALCAAQNLPFPRVLVAPPALLSQTVPQFVPEFFLYDYLFVYGAAFDAQRRAQRLQFAMHAPQIPAAKQALRMTLTGPDADELQAMAAAAPAAGLDDETIATLTAQSAHMAIKVDGVPQPLESLIDCVGFDAKCCVHLLDGALSICQSENNAIVLRSGSQVEQLALHRPMPIRPFVGLPPPTQPARPQTFALQVLGSRSGFDLSGPTTGFLLWINGRALLWDGPPGTTTLLAQQGISLSDVDGIVLSHCHEDHMGAFVEMVLCGRRLSVYTSEPIYRSALVKLAGYLNISVAAAAHYIDYVCVVPEVPCDLLGAQWTFFYTVHAIPTLGARIEMRRDGRTYAMQISGDQMHHAGLLQMRQRGQLSAARYDRMRQLVPATREPDSLYFVDVGEALIHGHPGDFTRNPNNIHFYHCPDNAYTRSFERPVAAAGDLHVLIEEPRRCALPPARLWQALQVLDLQDPTWLGQIVHGGHWRTLRTGECIHFGPQARKQLCLVVSGQLGGIGERRSDNDPSPWPADTWGAGDLFGHLGSNLQLDAGSKEALTPSELFTLDAGLLDRFLVCQGQGERLARLCALRAGSTPLPFDAFLTGHLRRALCRAARLTFLPPQAPLPGADALSILLEGSLEVGAQHLVAAQQDSYVGAGCLAPDGASQTAFAGPLGAWIAVLDGPMVRRLASLCAPLRQRLGSSSPGDDGPL